MKKMMFSQSFEQLCNLPNLTLPLSIVVAHNPSQSTTDSKSAPNPGTLSTLSMTALWMLG